MSDNLVEVRGLTKQYPGVKALKGIDLDIRRGTVHCVVGENGAGKSTFIKILTGAEQSDGGAITFDGGLHHPRSIKDAMNAGISVLYQELNVIDQLTVRDNLSLGKEKRFLGVIQRDDEASAKAIQVLRELDPGISPDAVTGTLSVAKKQVVEIAKAIAENARLIVMDEPTAAISDEETRRLFTLIDELKKKDVTIVYISHRLDEIFRIGDRLSVFRDGEIVATKEVGEVEGKAELIRLMLGKVVFQKYQSGHANRQRVVLEARGLSNRVLKDVSFQLYEKEILGFYGLIGAGKTEIARAVYGVDQFRGQVLVDGRPVRNRIPRDAIRNDLALVPEERRTEGIFGGLSIRENLSLMNVGSVLHMGVVSEKKEMELAGGYIEKLRIATASMEKQVAYLSGGNQQKVVLAKCMNARTKILMMDEPTRGIDVGAKSEIHTIIRELAAEGMSVMVFSSELQEILNLCDRIVLLSEGEIVKIVDNGEDIDQTEILHYVTGG